MIKECTVSSETEKIVNAALAEAALEHAEVHQDRRTSNPVYWEGKDTSGPAMAWEKETREFNPSRLGDLPRPIDFKAGLMLMPEWLVVEGYLPLGNIKAREFYPANSYGVDSALFEFQTKYNSVRGATVHPLYDLTRRP